MRGKKIILGAVVVGGGQFFVYFFSFIRNVILARMLTQTEFGLAAVFALTINLIDLNNRMNFVFM